MQIILSLDHCLHTSNPNCPCVDSCYRWRTNHSPSKIVLCGTEWGMVTQNMDKSLWLMSQMTSVFLTPRDSPGEGTKAVTVFPSCWSAVKPFILISLGSSDLCPLSQHNWVSLPSSQRPLLCVKDSDYQRGHSGPTDEWKRLQKFASLFCFISILTMYLSRVCRRLMLRIEVASVRTKPMYDELCNTFK